MRAPARWDPQGSAAAAFFARIRASGRPLLICDYDGTLAPFQVDKMQAVPAPEVVRELERIASGRTKIAFVTGRPSAELIQLLPLASGTEIWGMHGREHRLPDGAHRLLEPSAEQRAALDAAQQSLRAAGLERELERKVASLAVHWRGSEQAETIQRDAQAAFAPHEQVPGLAVLSFDGGLELRAEDRNKGHAVEDLLFSAEDPAAAAFLGDDFTDEDAFRAMLAAGGLGLLVREPVRDTHAPFCVHPDSLLQFLAEWP